MTLKIPVIPSIVIHIPFCYHASIKMKERKREFMKPKKVLTYAEFVKVVAEEMEQYLHLHCTNNFNRCFMCYG